MSTIHVAYSPTVSHITFHTKSTTIKCKQLRKMWQTLFGDDYFTITRELATVAAAGRSKSAVEVLRI